MLFTALKRNLTDAARKQIADVVAVANLNHAQLYLVNLEKATATVVHAAQTDVAKDVVAVVLVGVVEKTEDVVPHTIAVDVDVAGSP